MGDSILIYRVGRFGITVLAMALVLMPIGAPMAQAQQYRYSKLHDFTGSTDGATPTAGLVMDSTGKLYGIASAGGVGYGTVFRLVKKSGWIFTPLYEFGVLPDGEGSHSRVLVAPDGGVYGATISGGTGNCSFNGYSGCGTVFNLKPKPSVCKSALCFWDETQLYLLTGASDGASPYGDLTPDASGNLYGSVYRGGGNGCGLIYELVKGKPWTETVLYSFLCGNDGNSPHAGVVFDKSGNLYGTTIFGGQYGYGVIFELTPSGSGWTERVIYTFQGGSDGGFPQWGPDF
jgi:uncharacterized repeat protein (TIGR03803 family)